MAKIPTENLILRNFLRADRPTSKAIAFTPDIIPHYGNHLQPDLLIHEYNQFISLPIVPNETNYIYVRGLSVPNVEKGARTAVVLRAVPSELILWPQVWNKTNLIGPGPLVVKSCAPNEVVACATPFRFTPPNMGGINYALVATQYPIHTLPSSETRLRDTFQPPPDVKNWKDLLNFFKSDTSTVFYNVVIADPKAPIITVSTRLRVIDDGTDPVSFFIAIQCSAIPDGTLVSLSSTSGAIQLAKSNAVGLVGLEVLLPPGFDDIITLNIFPGSDNFLQTLSWISLQINVKTGGTGPVQELALLGALNILFHDEATTHLQHASHASIQLQEYLDTKKSDANTTSADASESAIVFGRTATGWWFRDRIGEANYFPRAVYGCFSPDIQPVGTTNKPDFKSILFNRNEDWSSNHGVNLQQGAPNYIYLRGNCTLGNDYVVEARLFCMPGGILNTPSMYFQHAVMDDDDHTGSKTAFRRIISTSPNSFNVLDRPFNLLNPVPPPRDSHYCFIAETRHPTEENPDPSWPHEDIGSKISSSAFNNWIASTPTVCWRNIGYLHGGSDLICATRLELSAEVFTPCTVGYVVAEAYNAPVGSSWEMTSDIAIPGLDIQFPRSKIVSGSKEIRGCGFTGVPSSGVKCQVVLQWFSEGKAAPDGMTIEITLYEDVLAIGTQLTRHLATTTLPEEVASWPFTVGIHHPGVENKADGSNTHIDYLGHRFKDIGPNHWPHQKWKVHMLGTDSWVYKVE